MTILRFDQRFYDAAKQHIAERDSAEGKSPAWVEGLTESIAWHLAGLPITPGRDRYTECPYPRGMAEYESYCHFQQLMRPSARNISLLW